MASINVYIVSSDGQMYMSPRSVSSYDELNEIVELAKTFKTANAIRFTTERGSQGYISPTGPQRTPHWFRYAEPEAERQISGRW
jgi:hypothetical protein